MKRAVAILMAAWLMPLAALAQDWKDYPYPDAGFAIQFPAPPTVERTTFQTSTGMTLPSTRYSLRQERIVYALDVVDYSAVPGDGMTVIAQTEKAIGASGTVTVAIDARINREYGRELSVNGADGSRSAVGLFYVDKHLYVLVGKSLPPDALARSGDAVRFQQSLQFIGANGGFGGAGGFGGPGRGRFRGGFNPQALAACTGKSAGDSVQLDTPRGPVTATCTLVARPNRPPAGPEGPNGFNGP